MTRALAIGSHIDSVPDGGWLDGALGVMAGVGILRSWVEAGEAPPRPLVLVDFADEEGARFGVSLVGSSAVSGRLDTELLADAKDAGGEVARDVLAANGVEVERMPESAARLEQIGAYLELHIEQGPVLDDEGAQLAAVRGCVGIERFRLVFTGQASHAGTTPMDRRRDAGVAAAATALAVEALAREIGGGAVGTTGRLDTQPGIITAVAGEADLHVDLRHADRDSLAQLLEGTLAAAQREASERDCEVRKEPVWRIEPTDFDAGLVEAARSIAGGRVMTSGALHDAAEMARRVPTAMMFVPSIGGTSHAAVEDTAEDDLRAGIEAFAELAARACQPA